MPKVSEEARQMAILHGRVQRWFWREPKSSQRQRQVLAEHRRMWLQGHGLPIRTTGASANDRKHAEELWKGLESAELVTIRATKGRRTHVKFTEKGQVLIDCLTATGCRFIWWHVFAAFVEKCQKLDRYCLPESYVAGLEPWTGASEENITALKSMHISLAPFVTAGDVKSCCDTLGLHWLLLTDEGEKTFEQGQPPEPPDDWQLDEAVSDIYDQAYRDAATEIEQAEPESTREVQIPIGAGMGWGDYEKYLVLEKGWKAKRAEQQAERERWMSCPTGETT